MNAYLLEMFLVSLLLTIVVELGVVFLCTWGVHRMGAKSKKCLSAGRRCRLPISLPAVCEKRGLLPVVLVNLLTNPPAVLLCWLARQYLPGMAGIVQLAVETAVVAAEAYVFCSFAKEPRWGICRPVLLSVTANLCSWLTGIGLQAVRNI